MTSNKKGRSSSDAVPIEATVAAPLMDSENARPSKDNWDNSIEFLMSCIALSVGLGNVWRFPFTALENGGGAFLVPYIIVLLVVGKPIYYMEMLLGQFSGRDIVGVFDIVPLMRGVGYAQLLALGVLATYYASVMALTLRYFFDSFSLTLPWSFCREEWTAACISAAPVKLNRTAITSPATNLTSSTQLYLQLVINEAPNLNNGIGFPDPNLALMLALSWLIVVLIIIGGIKSSGKASYFLALFPYAIMAVLLVRAITLPGAYDGIMYFLTPQWNKLWEPEVWYNAVTQVFFSLAVCFGVIVMYSSYNRFGHNVYRDAHIVTTLDTFTSLISGIIIFGILGNLAYESNTKDIGSVVKGGPGLAFISYPDAIAKFKLVPQLFSVLFFAMLFLLGIGSNVGMVSCILHALKGHFKHTAQWLLIVALAVMGFLIGLIYITPGGQYIITLLDFHGVTFVSLVSAIFELIAVGGIYGVRRFCRDAEYMLNIKTSLYYRLCWSIVTPTVMIIIFIYSIFTMKPLTYNNTQFPMPYRVLGWTITAIILGQLIFWALVAVFKQSKGSLKARVLNALRPSATWGPANLQELADYQAFLHHETQS